MRSGMTALLAVCLLAGPVLGIINVTVSADGSVVDGKVQLANGETTTIRISVQSGDLIMFAGDVKPTGTLDLLNSNPGSFAWVPGWDGFGSTVGTPGANGEWDGFAASWGYFDAAWPAGQIASYTVTAGPTGTGDVTLAFAARTINGIKPAEGNKATVLGTLTPVTIHVAPEPVTLALLALGGLMLSRRRR
jgi:hypothetical protein